eukprot:gene19454-27558_t
MTSISSGKRSWGKRGPQGEPQARRKSLPRRCKGLNEQLPYLDYVEGQPCKLEDFENTVTIFLSTQYHQYGMFMKTGKDYLPVAPVEPVQARDEHDHRSVQDWTMYYKVLFSHNQDMKRAQEVSTMMYNILLGQLSTSSTERIKEHPKWPDAEKTMSPYSLWTCIKESHRTAQTGTSFLDNQAAIVEYYSMKQGEHESLAVFKKRFEEQ